MGKTDDIPTLVKLNQQLFGHFSSVHHQHQKRPAASPDLGLTD